MTDHEKVRELILAKLAKEQAPIALDPTKSALLIVDMQHFFASPESRFAEVFGRVAPGMMDGYFDRVRSAVLPNVQRLQQCFRSKERPVIFCSWL